MEMARMVADGHLLHDFSTHHGFTGGPFTTIVTKYKTLRTDDMDFRQEARGEFRELRNSYT